MSRVMTKLGLFAERSEVDFCMPLRFKDLPLVFLGQFFPPAHSVTS
jgi:hypothetical protein